MAGANPKTRPAEWTAAAAAIALLIVSILGVDDPAVLTALGIVIGFIPTAVTSIVEYIKSTKKGISGD
jgi:hypothetical protein